MILKDFNAYGGSRPCNSSSSSSEDDQWENVTGPHRVGEMNEAGEEFLLSAFSPAE